MTITQIVGIMLGAALFGFLLGLWVRSKLPREVCSCHTPAALALYRFAARLGLTL